MTSKDTKYLINNLIKHFKLNYLKEVFNDILSFKYEINGSVKYNYNNITYFIDLLNNSITEIEKINGFIKKRTYFYTCKKISVSQHIFDNKTTDGHHSNYGLKYWKICEKYSFYDFYWKDEILL